MLFDFDGEKISESRLGILANSDDSSIRKRARYASKKGYADNAEKIGAYLKRAFYVQLRKSRFWLIRNS